MLRASIMASCKPAKSLLAESKGERTRSGRLVRWRLEAGEMRFHSLNLLPRSLQLVACAAGPAIDAAAEPRWSPFRLQAG